MSYRVKLILIISLMIALSVSIAGTILVAVSFQVSLDAETEAALRSFESVQNTLSILNAFGTQANSASLGEALMRMTEQNAGHWQALSLRSGAGPIYESQGEMLLSAPLTVSDMVKCSYVVVDDQYGHGLIAMSSLVAGVEQLTLSARFDLSKGYVARATQLRLFTWVYIVVMVLGIAGAILLSYTLTSRLHRLTGAVRRISGGDLTIRSKIRSKDEFGQLSRDFDAMADKLQENITRMETQMQRQESFMGAFAHELKTPMTAIIGFADLLRQGSLDENTRMMAAEYIYSEGHRLEKLSFKLLDLLLLKKDALVMKRVGLSSYIGEIDRAMSPVMKNKGIRLVCKAEPKKVTLEPDLVKSLIYNLIDNAGKAMDDGGIIAVMATAIPGGCQIQVVDNGRGMEPEELSKITEAFYRVDKSRSRKQGGAGLGLALCKQIVELHSGTMHYDSQPGKGTRVTVTLYGKEARG